jgi:hypothetical protein
MEGEKSCVKCNYTYEEKKERTKKRLALHGTNDAGRSKKIFQRESRKDDEEDNTSNTEKI